MNNIIQLTTVDREPRASTVQIAEQLGIAHKAAFQLVRRYESDFSQFGLVAFEMEAVKIQGARSQAA